MKLHGFLLEYFREHRGTRENLISMYMFAYILHIPIIGNIYTYISLLMLLRSYQLQCHRYSMIIAKKVIIGDHWRNQSNWNLCGISMATHVPLQLSIRRRIFIFCVPKNVQSMSAFQKRRSRCDSCYACWTVLMVQAGRPWKVPFQQSEVKWKSQLPHQQLHIPGRCVIVGLLKR